MVGHLAIDDGKVAAVRRLRGHGVRTALRSNTWGVERAMRDDILELSDTTVLSGEVGLRDMAQPAGRASARSSTTSRSTFGPPSPPACGECSTSGRWRRSGGLFDVRLQAAPPLTAAWGGLSLRPTLLGARL